MTDRLKWARAEDGALRAEFEGGYATIRRDTSSGGWLWLVKIGDATSSDISNSTQNASNAANDALTRVRATAANQKADADRKAELLAKIEEVTVAADPDVVSIFEIATASLERLSWLMNQVRHRTRTPGLNKLIDALSRELYKFRTGERR